MITADEARKISDSNSMSERDAELFKYAMDQIERNIRDTANRGGRSFSDNVTILTPGHYKPNYHLCVAVAKELTKNGFSYHEDLRYPNGVWFEVSW